MKQKTKRRSYKNAIAIGIASFASIALISTGLAAFVIIRDTQAEIGGNINIGQVVQSDIELHLDGAVDGKLLNKHIVIDADKDDKSGRVQSEIGSVGETLFHNFSGTVSVGSEKTVAANLNFYYIASIKYNPSNSSAETDFIAQFITENRLAYKDSGMKFNESVPISVTPEGGKPNEGTFAFDFGFMWGSKYKGINPSIYYDTDVDGKLVSPPDVLAELESLQLQKEVGGADQLNYYFEIIIYAENK